MKTFTPRGADLDELYTATGTTMLTDRWWYQRGHYPLCFFRGFKEVKNSNDPGSALPVSSANCLLSIVPPNGMVITSFFASAPLFWGHQNKREITCSSRISYGEYLAPFTCCCTYWFVFLSFESYKVFKKDRYASVIPRKDVITIPVEHTCRIIEKGSASLDIIYSL